MDHNNSIDKIQEWDLYHAYGKFNIEYELMMNLIRASIISLLYKNYEIKVDRGNENLDYEAKRPLKILLSELSSSSLIRSFMSLVFEANIQDSINIATLEEKKIIELLFKKVNETNELRNKIVHSMSWISDNLIFSNNGGKFQIKKDGIHLVSQIDRISKEGYQLKQGWYKISDYENYIEGIENLMLCINEMNNFFQTGELNILRIKKRLHATNMKAKH